MALRQNKYLYLFFTMLLSFFNLQAQIEAPIYIPPPELTIPTDSATESSEVETDDADNEDNFYEGYNFRDLEQSNYNSQKLEPQFDKAYWDKERKTIKFNETRDTTRPKNKKDSINNTAKKTNKSNRSFNFANLKFVFIAIALILLLILIVVLLKNSSAKNQKVNSNILVNFDDLDETTLRNAELLTPLSIAIKQGDYQTAYRIKYLEVLQKLIHKNLIYYKKEKTNYEYLMQLTGKNVYESFRQLTFNFDGIWYGEMKIDQARYESLLPNFYQFEQTINEKQ